jgi:predicted SnoaL-like aldol condensation-catalyzing enzyme
MIRTIRTLPWHHLAMKFLASSLAIALTCASLSLVARQQPQPSADEQQAKMRVVMEFYRPGITPEERIALIHRDYQQHNQFYVKYAKDRNISNFEAFSQIRRQQGVDQAAAAAKAREVAAARGPITPAQAPAPAGNTFHILYAEGNLVVRIAQRWAPDPASPQSFYENFFGDTFEVRDGKLYEHWDAGLIADPNARPNPNPPPPAAASTVPVPWPPAAAVPAPGCTATPPQVAENKRIASRFFQVAGAERLALIDETYIQHNPVFRRYAIQNRISDYETVKRAIGGTPVGQPGTQAQASGPQPPAGNPLERVVGACDVVTIIHKVYRQDPTAPPGTFYDSYTWDTFRVRNGKLVEHWDGVTLPAQAAGPVGSSN